MEIEPFLVASSLMAVIAQRLLRFLCNHCKEPYEPHDDELLKIGIRRSQMHDGVLYRARGCDKCFNMGYSGRTGIFEMLMIDDDIRNLTLSQVDSTKIKRKAMEHGMTTLRMDGAEKVARGLTSVDEVMRVTEEESVI
jgi:type II secretory ATPase GspE/PulE/Tfp pilus assembly ATPase PilB-like protein